ncbi:DUF5405 family protein [Pectobacterium carotovorum]|uniref:DUF5405 family protein n=1 Tax=Pectobacterium carotovorum TaxID=554 RepID=UPI002087D3F7|nr:DUF5405 family protein [Pectobacterium carotovorum]GKV89340.1 hypothetical protein PEC301619_13220 [Pectobacterium carotovorum subsp. carotovorum]
MEISIGDKYVITADQYQYVLQERKTKKDGKDAGGEYLSTIGYYTKLPQLISRLCHLDVMTSDVQTLQAVEQRIARLSLEIETAFGR